MRYAEQAVRDHALVQPARRASAAQRKKAFQNSFLSPFAGKALTTVLAGLAFSKTVLPNISLLPALVAGFLRVLIMTRPGITNFPFFFVSSVPMLASVEMTCAATPFLSSHPSAMAAASAPFVMTLAFIGAISAMRYCGTALRNVGA